ncbi:MAG: aminoglycoside 3-N-acetyltransferase [Acidobacteria bacterium]|nr:aminoglycoside 3-N-acetyltransferase [Acidobacteriota bacterium]
MSRSNATRSSLRRDFELLGVAPGSTVMVHGAMRQVGPVTGGVNTVINALLDALGPAGTVAAYVDFEPFFEDGDPEIPVFDKRIAPAARDHGVLHETLLRWPGAVRSDHPDAGVAAIGPQAAWITAGHPFQYGYGEGSPFEKLVRLGVQVLMIGAPLDTITLLHYAEHRARIPGKRIIRYRRLMPGANGPVWMDFEEFDTGDPVHDSLPGNCFERIALDYLASGQGRQGRVGAADSYLLDGAGLVDFGIRWIETAING